MNQDQIKKENRKAFPKFLLIVVAGALLGFAGCFGCKFINDQKLLDTLAPAFQTGLRILAAWGIPAVWVLLILPGALLFRKAKIMFRSWDGEDTICPEQIDHTLELFTLFASIAQLLVFLFFTISASVGYRSLMLLATVELLISQAALMWLQQKVVDLNRLLNPEKDGSVYDLHFHKKWMQSCDEAEQLRIGQAAFAAFKATNIACMSLWVLLFFGHFFFDLPIFATFIVILIWGVLLISYCVACMRMK